MRGARWAAANERSDGAAARGRGADLQSYGNCLSIEVIRARTQRGPDSREWVFSSTNTRGGFSDSRRRARPRRSRASTRSASVAVRFRLECLMHGKPQKAKS